MIYLGHLLPDSHNVIFEMLKKVVKLSQKGSLCDTRRLWHYCLFLLERACHPYIVRHQSVFRINMVERKIRSLFV
jgi:hypothetical protein